MTITFKEFIKDYCKYYNEKEVIVRDNSEMQEVYMNCMIMMFLKLTMMKKL